MPNTIPSPYNFVPLSEHVYLPDWADQVSHDIPFSDGISGWFEITVTAESPVYVRNGGVYERNPESDTGELKRLPGESTDEYQARKRAYPEFFQVTQGGDYAIPGPSIRGAIRNVLEIASFGKFCRVDDRRYGVRDLQNLDLYGRWMTTRTPEGAFKPLVRPGWLTACADGWRIVPCSVARIEQEFLEQSIAKGSVSFLSELRGYEKRELWLKQGLPLEVRFDGSQFRDGFEEIHRHMRRNGSIRLQYHKIRNTGGETVGELVFTGQPTPRKRRHDRDRQPGRKHMEFVFFNCRENKAIGVSESVRKDFEFIHSTEEGRPNDEWAYWKRKLTGPSPERVPVFYLLDEDGSLHSFGLAMMYRLPYKYRISEKISATSSSHLAAARDMAELIFGYVDGKEALRGRVSVGALVCPRSQAVHGPKVTKILGSPKPTYYPTYVRQKITADGRLSGEYQTYMDKHAELSGWKRYPGCISTESSSVQPSKLTSTFHALGKGSTFSGRVHVHNLRPIEVGALVWALTWGGEAGYRHRVGMAKPFGFGLVRIELKKVENLRTLDGRLVDPSACARQFVQHMERIIVGGWKGSLQIQNLLAMADPNRRAPHELKYPVLGQQDNEFGELKKARAVLPPFVAGPDAGRSPGGAGHPGRPSTPAGPAPARKIPLIDRIRGQVLEFNARKKKQKWVFEAVVEGQTIAGYLQEGFEKLPRDLDRNPKIKLRVKGFSSGTYQLYLP